MREFEKRRAQILAEMNEIERMERGRLSAEYRERSEKGQTRTLGPYYKHQRWEDGRNISQRVRADQVDSLREALDGHERFKVLSEEFADATIRLTRQEQTGESKKNAKKRKRNATGRPKRS